MDSSAWPAPLAGQTILVAEDDALISFDIDALLTEAGARVLTASDQREAMLASTNDDPTAAVLDIRLGVGSIDPTCECLARRSIPFLFLTGDSGKDVQKWAPAPILSKPFDGRVLIERLISVLVTGGDFLDLADTTRIDPIIFGAQARLLRQGRIVRELTRDHVDYRSADGLHRIMLESVALLQAHRRKLLGGKEVGH